jgi:hypothetical protein
LLARHSASEQTPNVEHRTSNIELRRKQPAKFRRSVFGVGCSAFSFSSRKVRGAWWPSSVVESWTLRFFNAQRSTFNAQRSIQTVGRWMLDVGRWTFASFRRVKGAWWPSRSSKPLSVRKSRGRFDSCPLRQSIFDFPGGLIRTSQSLIRNSKGGECPCPATKSVD